MSKIMRSLFSIRLLDDFSKKETFIHRIHPLVKLLTTIVYLSVVVSFERYEISRLMPFLFYPALTLALAEIPLEPILKRVLLIEPFIMGIGILNPFFDRYPLIIGGVAISRGWITFLSLIIKSGLTATAALLLVATTGIQSLALALRLLKIPKVFVSQFLLTYRYITVLMEEVFRRLRAYTLRSYHQKGVIRSAWGSLAGGLILRTYERARRVYQAMLLRGFSGEYHTGDNTKIRIQDLIYLTGWTLFFSIARIYDLPMLIGSLFTGVIR